jgi:hypothetical protein
MACHLKALSTQGRELALTLVALVVTSLLQLTTSLETTRSMAMRKSLLEVATAPKEQQEDLVVSSCSLVRTLSK